MKKELMAEAYKQLSIFLDACMARDERADFVKDESLNNLKKLFDDKKFNEALDEYKAEFENKIIDNSELLHNYQESEKNNIEAYTEFIDNLKAFIILYINKVKVE